MTICAACFQPAARLRRVDVDGEAYNVCGSCRRGLAKIQRPARRGQKPLKARLLEPASEADKAWFAGHPGRSHRLRPPIGGEILTLSAPAGRRPLVLVRQVKPGARLKAALTWPADLPLPINAEAVGAGLWAEVAGRQPLLSEAEALIVENAP